MILTINIRNKSLYCLVTTNIRTVSIIDTCVNVTMNFESYVDSMKIYTESLDECQQIYDRIVYCVNKPTEAIMFSKDYLAIDCKDMTEFAQKRDMDPQKLISQLYDIYNKHSKEESNEDYRPRDIWKLLASYR